MEILFGLMGIFSEDIFCSDLNKTKIVAILIPPDAHFAKIMVTLGKIIFELEYIAFIKISFAIDFQSYEHRLHHGHHGFAATAAIILNYLFVYENITNYHISMCNVTLSSRNHTSSYTVSTSFFNAMRKFIDMGFAYEMNL